MKLSDTKKLILVSCILIVGAGIAAVIYQIQQTKVPAMVGINLREELVRPDSHAQGPENAPLTVVEFLDPECESCMAFYPIMKSFLDENQGKVRFVVRYMAFHVSSEMAVAALESAALQGKYWEYLETLFTMAGEWGHRPQPEIGFFEKYAEGHGLDLVRFRSDMQNPKWKALVERDMKDGQTMGVRGTPTVFLNGEMLDGLDSTSLRFASRRHLGNLQK
jgi:protein-disulfide isomerase